MIYNTGEDFDVLAIELLILVLYSLAVFVNLNGYNIIFHHLLLDCFLGLDHFVADVEASCLGCRLLHLLIVTENLLCQLQFHLIIGDDKQTKKHSRGARYQ
jgi:hypothetical protein